jgi:hypothetical protein
MDALEKLRARGPPPTRTLPSTHAPRRTPPLAEQRAQAKRLSVAATPSPEQPQPQPRGELLAELSEGGLSESRESLSLLSMSIDAEEQRAGARKETETERRALQLGHVSPKFKQLIVNTADKFPNHDDQGAMSASSDGEADHGERGEVGGRSPRLSDTIAQRASNVAAPQRTRRGAPPRPRPTGTPPGGVSADTAKAEHAQPEQRTSRLPSYLRPTKSSKKRLQPMGTTRRRTGRTPKSATSSPHARSFAASPRRSPRKAKQAVKSPKARAQLNRLRNFASTS